MSLPIFIENSKVPVFFSKIFRMHIVAMSLGIFVFCRNTPLERTRIHETIHWKQQVEMLFVLMWLAYLLFFVIGLFRYGSLKQSYHMIPFEREAYDNHNNLYYVGCRKFWAWITYV